MHLPSESKSAQTKPEPDDHFIAISVDAHGDYFLDNRAIDLGDLRVRLRTYGTESKPPIIRIRADGAVPYEKIIHLMDEAKQANLLKVTFDTQTEGQ